MPTDDRVREALDACIARVRHDLDARLRDLPGDVLAAARDTARDARLETVRRLLTAARGIDDATSLSSILEALLRAASAEAARVAVLLVEDDRLVAWGHHGFAPGAGPATLPIDASRTLAAAVTAGQSVVVPPADGDLAPVEPAFMCVPVGATGVAIPLAVGGTVVAVLYADDVDRTDGRDDAAVWTEALALLARHAAVCLERLTSTRTVELLARSGRQ